MTLRTKILLGAGGWVAAITLLYVWLSWPDRSSANIRLRVGFLPVT